MVLDSLRVADGGVRFETVPLVTSGDTPGGPGPAPDFTDSIDRALVAGTIDLAVHSAKDLPIRLDPSLLLAACPPRVDPRDALVVSGRLGRAPLPRGARVGSSSPRRRAQLLRWRSDVRLVEIQGNVDTRLERLERGDVDALVLAMAGLRRLGRTGSSTRPLGVDRFLPAPGQGALAIVVRTGDSAMGRLARAIDHPPTHRAVIGERAFAAELGADCRHPVAALASSRGGRFRLTGELLSPNGARRLRTTRTGPLDGPEDVGTAAAAALRRRGSDEILSRPV